MPRSAAAATVLCLAMAGASATAEDGPWWENEPLRIIQTNLRQIDADRDPAVIVRQVKDLGANTILFSCGGIRAFYQTDLKYHKKAIALNGDFAVEARRIAREQGLRFIGRLDLSKGHAGFREDNPDWFQRGADGVSHDYNGLHVACPNGTYSDVAVRVVLGGGSEPPESRLLVSGRTTAAKSGVYTVPRLGLFETIAIPLQ